jgi:predicted nucleotidyltransferase
MDANAFTAWFAGRLAALPGVVAVALGGSRAAGTATDSSDWDFALYYRGAFDPDDLRALGFDGAVFDIGAWGGGVMNGGAWLKVEGRSVDVMYRDLNDVEHWWHEAEAGRYEKQLLPFHVAGIPTYTVVGELAVGAVLSGELPRPTYPEALAVSAGSRWRIDATLSAGYARKAWEQRGDATVAIANGSRALLELAHSRAALSRRWVLNEKGLVRASGLGDLGDALVFAADGGSLASALLAIENEAGRE